MADIEKVCLTCLWYKRCCNCGEGKCGKGVRTKTADFNKPILIDDGDCWSRKSGYAPWVYALLEKITSTEEPAGIETQRDSPSSPS